MLVLGTQEAWSHIIAAQSLAALLIWGIPSHRTHVTVKHQSSGSARVCIPGSQEQAEAPLVQAGILPPNFADSWALNVYHDGSEGIQSHYDDAGRFMRPITSLRLFSDCRLSFGTQLYG